MHEYRYRNCYCWVLSMLLLLAILQQPALAIVGVGRDLILTPKQQPPPLAGKRVYYEERPPLADQQAHQSWQHTLKHVTYVTLFTAAAVEAAAGNLSQLHGYHDFLQAPYVPAVPQAGVQATVPRFGDIVTLASGRLEQLPANGSYRFVETNDDRAQRDTGGGDGAQLRALWRVQRIRHRAGGDSHKLPQRYHYEMKFSISPLGNQVNSWIPQSPQTFIQKESDYPQSFGRVAYEEARDQSFAAQRRQDRQPQATFVRGIFQPPEPPNLNIGEYIKGAQPEAPKSGANLELFPGLFNYIPATTFRPNYPSKFGQRAQFPPTLLRRYPLPTAEVGPSGVADVSQVPGAPVTHHFHHHFYVASGDGNHKPDLAYRPPSFDPEFPKFPRPNQQLEQEQPTQGQEEEQEQTHGQEVQFPTSGESLQTGDDSDQLLRSPSLYKVSEQSVSGKYQTSKLAPLLIYAGTAEAPAAPGEDHKAFVQSEPLEETIYRYSEPDPLYAHQQPQDVLQVEAPHNYAAAENYAYQEPGQDQATKQVHAKKDKEEADEDDDEDEEQGEQQPSIVNSETEQRLAGSQKQPKVVATEVTSTTTTSTTTTTTEVPKATVQIPTSQASFISTSTSSTPLRIFSRYRTTPRITAGRSTTSTTSTMAPPKFSKWKLRRKDNATANVDSKPKSSYRHESKIATSTTTTTTTTTPSPPPTSTTMAANHSHTTPSHGRDVVEVLTQKSVSKSVSIKVGENGEEIPIIVDDVENEVILS